MLGTAAYLHRLFRFFTDLIFPYRCLGCRMFLENTYICDACVSKIPTRYRLECVGCRKTSPFGMTCPDCRSDNALNRIYIASDFNDPIVAAAIKALKYRFIRELAEPLARLAITFIQNQSGLRRIVFAGQDFLVMPVPLHRYRENWRGFNQARLLADRIAVQYRLARSEALVRAIHSEAQAGIADRDVRLAHARQTYACPRPDEVRGRNILLVDDVCTTGATLNECARVLKSAGAASVCGLVIARG